MKHVLVAGGAGYVGSVLVPKLLNKGYQVTVYDILYYGDEGLPKNNSNLKVVKGDIRDTEFYRTQLEDVDAVIHLACISNDPSFELDPSLSRSINFDSFEPFVKVTKDEGVERFIYASTSSVYGVSDHPNVTEEHPLVPLTDYNKYKGMTEPLLLKHGDEKFTTVVIRPATVCGYSPRQRLDLSVNILTNFAFHKKKIRVFGGEQKRPNIHVEDITDLYIELLEMDREKIHGEIFNAGYQNHSIMDIAKIVKHVVEDECPEFGEIEIEVTDSDDKRSYHISSEKIKNKLGYTPKRTIEDAVRDLVKAFKDNRLPESFDDPKYFNIKTMKDSHERTQA